MAGFYILDVPEFAPLVEAARRDRSARVHEARAGYRLVEFADSITIERRDTGMREALWFGCLTAGLDGRIAEFSADRLRLVATNEPILG